MGKMQLKRLPGPCPRCRSSGTCTSPCRSAPAEQASPRWRRRCSRARSTPSRSCGGIHCLSVKFGGFLLRLGSDFGKFVQNSVADPTKFMGDLAQMQITLTWLMNPSLLCLLSPLSSNSLNSSSPNSISPYMRVSTLPTHTLLLCTSIRSAQAWNVPFSNFTMIYTNCTHCFDNWKHICAQWIT